MIGKVSCTPYKEAIKKCVVQEYLMKWKDDVNILLYEKKKYSYIFKVLEI